MKNAFVTKLWEDSRWYKIEDKNVNILWKRIRLVRCHRKGNVIRLRRINEQEAKSVAVQVHSVHKSSITGLVTAFTDKEHLNQSWKARIHVWFHIKGKKNKFWEAAKTGNLETKRQMCLWGFVSWGRWRCSESGSATRANATAAVLRL